MALNGMVLQSQIEPVRILPVSEVVSVDRCGKCPLGTVRERPPFGPYGEADHEICCDHKQCANLISGDFYAIPEGWTKD